MKKMKVDYTDFAKQVAINVSRNPELNKGVLICGTGAGMSITSNKLKGVKSILAHNRYTAKMSRKHNNSNIICLGAWINSDHENFEILNTWLNSNLTVVGTLKELIKLRAIIIKLF